MRRIPQTFAPSPGLITYFHPPGGLGVRVDSSVYQGYTVPPYYDSLIGKLIVHGRDRLECLMRLRRALDEFVVDGVRTTIPLFQDLVREPAIPDGAYDIRWLEEYLAARSAERRTDGHVARLPQGPGHRDAVAAVARLCLRHLPDGQFRRRPDALLGGAEDARRACRSTASMCRAAWRAPCAPKSSRCASTATSKR